MPGRSHVALRVAIALVALVAPVAPSARAAPTVRRVQFAFDLETIGGEIDANMGQITYDPAHRELFLASGRSVAVFKDGLQVFRFNVSEQIWPVLSVAPEEDGGLLVAGPTGVFRLDYRGQLRGRFEVKGAPPELASFTPDSVHHVAGRVYLASSQASRVVVCRGDGTFLASYDLATLAFKGKPRTEDDDIRSVSIDPDGNILFTLPMRAKVFVVSPRGQVRSFGKSGAKNGEFNVPGAVVRDERGIIYVSDLLRSTVLLFDDEFQFLGEFGGYGNFRESLVAPSSLAAGEGMLFVSQGGGRSVRAFLVVAE